MESLCVSLIHTLTHTKVTKKRKAHNTGVQLRSTDARTVVKIPVLYTKVSVTAFNPGHRVDGGCAVSNGMSRKTSLERHSESQL